MIIRSAIDDALSGLEKADVFVNDKRISCGFKDGKISAKLEEAFFREEEASDGRYCVKVRAEDKAGNTSEKEGVFFASISSDKPEITGAKDKSFVSAAPLIYISANEHKTKKLYVKVFLGGVLLKDIETDDASKMYSPEEDGEYEVIASCLDKAGNLSEEEKLSFVYDSNAPDATAFEISGKKRDGYFWHYSDVYINAEAADTLSGLKAAKLIVNGKEAGSNSFDGEQEGKLSAYLSKEWFKENESEDGKYDVIFRAEDRAGNVHKEKKSFFCDVSVPKVKLSGIKSGQHTNKNPEIKSEIGDNYAGLNENKIIIRRDGKSVKKAIKEGSSFSYSNFNRDGEYEVYAIATDKAGNTSESDHIIFVKDATAPVVSLKGVKEGSFNAKTVKITANVKEKNYRQVTVKVDTSCTLDNKAVSAAFGSVKPDSENFFKSVQFSKNGTYTLSLVAVDKAGNRSNKATLSFTVDTVKPVIKISGFNDINGYGSKISPKVTYEDSYFKSAQVNINGASSAKGLNKKVTKTERGGATSFSGFKLKREYDDIYTISCRAEDKAGNVSVVKKSFTLCRFGSSFKIKSGKMYNGKYVKEIESDITIIETNPAPLSGCEGKVLLDGENVDAKADVKLSRNAKGYHVARYTFSAGSFLKEGAYSLNASSKDAAGNCSELNMQEGKSFTFTVDKTPPVLTVTGVEEGKIYKGNDAHLKVDVKDNTLVKDFIVRSSAESNPVYESKQEEASGLFNLPQGVKQTVTVTAEDMAGNEGEAIIKNVTVSDSLFVRLINNPLFILAVILVLVGVAFVVMAIIRRKRN